MIRANGPNEFCDKSTLEAGVPADAGLIRLRSGWGGRIRVNGLSAARAAEIRRQIAAGTYLTDQKLNVAVERLLAVLRRRPRRTRTAVA